MDNLELITQLKKQAQEIPICSGSELDAVIRRAEMITRNVFGPTRKYLADIKEIDFYPNFAPTTDEYKVTVWRSGQQALLNLIQTMEEELKLFQLTASNQELSSQPKNIGNQVFIVHGHDEEMKQYVARTLSLLDLEAVILHEKPNQGRTIILSPDDVARSRYSKPEDEKFRARQNVILELGYFIGKLGRERVVTLYRQDKDFEMPSDFSGVLFVPFDPNGRWQFDLIRELKSCGYKVDANKLLD